QYRPGTWGPPSSLPSCALRLAQPRAPRARSMSVPTSTVFLLDVDNTLLDNDAVEADFHRHLAAQLGQDRTGPSATGRSSKNSELRLATPTISARSSA